MLAFQKPGNSLSCNIWGYMMGLRFFKYRTFSCYSSHDSDSLFDIQMVLYIRNYFNSFEPSSTELVGCSNPHCISIALKNFSCVIWCMAYLWRFKKLPTIISALCRQLPGVRYAARSSLFRWSTRSQCPQAWSWTSIRSRWCFWFCQCPQHGSFLIGSLC